MKSEKGYTLITLILCMFLLLILACISIALVVTADQEENNVNKTTPAYIEELTEEENIEVTNTDAIDNSTNENTIEELPSGV